jgi:hypothetical protein
MVAVTLHGADVGDTASLIETAIAAAEQVEAAHAARAAPGPRSPSSSPTRAITAIRR